MSLFGCFTYLNKRFKTLSKYNLPVLFHFPPLLLLLLPVLLAEPFFMLLS